MSKAEFLEGLQKGLSGLPKDDVNERLEFYGEMIDDLVEEGISEEDAVLQIGSVDEIISQIVADIPLSKLVKEKMTKNRKLKTLEILLLVLGSPIWLSLLIAAFAVIISVYVSLWAVIISFWAVFISLLGAGLCGIAGGTVFAFYNTVITGIAILGAGFVCVGLSIFAFFGCKAATKGFLLLTKKTVCGIKNCFIKKEEA